MIAGMVSKLAVTMAAALGLFVLGLGVSLPLGSEAAAPGSCVGPVGVAGAQPTTEPEPEPDASPSCADARDECMSGSAQTGIYGERYVPPEAVAMCMEAYRDCVGAEDAEG